MLLFVGRYMWRLSGQWRDNPEAVARLRRCWPWLLLALPVYAAGHSCSALYWRRLLGCFREPGPWWRAMRVYHIGSIGKYIPGKAFVVVFRTGLLSRAAKGRFMTAQSVFYETLSTLGVGGLVGGVCLVSMLPGQPLLYLLGLAAFAAVMAILHPAMFGRVSKWIAVPFGGTFEEGVPRQWWRVMWRSLPLMVGCWCFLGASLALTVLGTGTPFGSMWNLIAVIGVASVAMPAGFAVLFMPSGIGVRELVVVAGLEPVFGAGEAVIIALALRTVWTIGDLAIAGAFYAVPSAAEEADGSLSEVAS